MGLAGLAGLALEVSRMRTYGNDTECSASILVSRRQRRTCHLCRMLCQCQARQARQARQASRGPLSLAGSAPPAPQHPSSLSACSFPLSCRRSRGHERARPGSWARTPGPPSLVADNFGQALCAPRHCTPHHESQVNLFRGADDLGVALVTQPRAARGLGPRLRGPETEAYLRLGDAPVGERVARILRCGAIHLELKGERGFVRARRWIRVRTVHGRVARGSVVEGPCSPSPTPRAMLTCPREKLPPSAWGDDRMECAFFYF